MTTRHKARLSALESRQTASPRDLSHLTDTELSALLEARDRVLFGDEMV